MIQQTTQMKPPLFTCPICNSKVPGYTGSSYLWVVCDECGSVLAFQEQRITEGRWSRQEAAVILTQVQLSQREGLIDKALELLA
jgi:transcription initiation factor IIE alpha subunit